MANSRGYYLRSSFNNIPSRASLPTPSSDLCFEDVFNFPFIVDEDTVQYLINHGRVMFIVRGPSGTRKHTLSSMVQEKYRNSAICCADDYFSELFVAGTKSRENIKKSHEYCEQNALKACQEGKHPIVIKNTNVRKWEMQYYINLAIEYCYTIIMAITVRKLRVTPEDLEKTNTQGLSKTYFKSRLRQWEEVVPQYTGWMLSPADAEYLTNEVEECLESLVELEDFCSIFCANQEDNPKDFFTPVHFPFCLATYCHCGADSSARWYYLSDNVQSMYGKVFSLTVQAFVVTKSLTAAVVHLEEDMKTLVEESTVCNTFDASNLSDMLDTLSVCDVKPKQPLQDYVTDTPETFMYCSRTADDKIDTKTCSFIVLSTAIRDPPKYPYITNVSNFSDTLFSGVTDLDGNISTFHTLEDDFKYCKLSCDSWLILPPNKATLQSVFTGLYI